MGVVIKKDDIYELKAIPVKTPSQEKKITGGDKKK
jgi:hypothetical protein